ncbi:MAG: hypothetical protein HY291_18135 [Planctomycetes bacterium]|nr:hypothetical protein [Planctomycetota bacterium]
MSEPTTRRWFQIHLSTAVVLMFVAGALLFVEVRNFEAIKSALELAIGSLVGADAVEADSAGVVFPCVIVNLLVLVLVAWICEALIRRGEARTP